MLHFETIFIRNQRLHAFMGEVEALVNVCPNLVSIVYAIKTKNTNDKAGLKTNLTSHRLRQHLSAVAGSKTCWLCQLSLTPAQIIRRFSVNEPLLIVIGRFIRVLHSKSGAGWENELFFSCSSSFSLPIIRFQNFIYR
ncbi:Uncharacterised protein [Streptococcus merionis]|uniref:Uncharacterized protein n=2 Tax=Streptococcus merionis TaxID=400065 RepID=A0A239ST69_9STRE|nr:Uncharacterised protein [Streptococcus merionis]